MSLYTGWSMCLFLKPEGMSATCPPPRAGSRSRIPGGQCHLHTAPPPFTPGTFAPGRFPTRDSYSALPFPSPPPETCCQHSDIRVRLALVTLHTKAPSPAPPNPRPLPVSPWCGSSSDTLLSPPAPYSGLSATREEALVFLHYCIPSAYRGPSTHLQYLDL